MLLDFDALGRHGLLQFPPLQNAALIASSGSLTQSNRAATFVFGQASVVGELAVDGVAAGLQVKHFAGVADLTVGGNSVSFKSVALAAPGSSSIASVGSTFSVRLSLAVGSHAIAEGSSSFRTFSPAIPANYVVTGSNVAFLRDFEAWFPRPFGLNDWVLRAIENGDWRTKESASPSWTLATASSASWVVADKQPETWSAK